METLRYVLVANGLLAVVSIAYYALLRRETFFGANRLALWLGLAGALVLPLLKLPDWRPQPVRHLMQRTAQVIVPNVLPRPLTAQPEVTITFPNRKTYRALRTQQQPADWSWQLGLIALYITGVFCLSIRFCLQLVSLRKLIRHSIHEPYDDFTLVSNETVTSPFSFFGWVVVNPSQHTPDELDQILRHERVHVRERHSVDMIGAELVCLVFWFNPAAYLFRHLLQQTLEFYADRAVLTQGIDAQAYQYNLLKVSLLSNQSAITNHFSKSQLKSRIVMLNRRTSPKTTWLKYPVFFLAALTVASAFARPQHLRALRKYVPKPIAETFSAVVAPPVRPIHPVSETIQLASHSLEDTAAKRNAVRKLLTEPVEQQPDSSRSIADSDSVRVSPSRYIVYEGNRIWWIITPRATFDDFVSIKKELAKYDYTLQLIETKYDPRYTYIDRLDYKLINNTSGNSTGQSGDGAINKPILTTGGYIEPTSATDSKKYRSTSYGSIHPTARTIPTAIRNVIIEDEALVTDLITNQKIDSIVRAGSAKFYKLGDSSQTFKRDFFQTPSKQISGITIQPDGSLSVDEAFKNAEIFINGYPASPEAVRIWSVKQLMAIVKKTKYDPAKKQSSPSVLLIYTTEKQ